MSSDTSPPPTPTTTSARRASFTPGQKLSGLFSRSPPTNNGTSAYPGPIVTAAANAQAQQRRRTSLSLGIGGSPTATSPFSANSCNRQSSFGSSNSPSGSIEENAIEDGDAASNSPPPSPFLRRMSFGARALRDARGGAGTMGNVNGRASNSLASAPSVKGRGLSLSQSAFHLPCRQSLTPRVIPCRGGFRLVRADQESS